jgi:hypothetical protein
MAIRVFYALADKSAYASPLLYYSSFGGCLIFINKGVAFLALAMPVVEQFYMASHLRHTAWMSDASFPHCKLCRQPNYACVCVDDDYCAMDIDDEMLVSAIVRQPLNVVSLDHERSRLG